MYQLTWFACLLWYMVQWYRNQYHSLVSRGQFPVFIIKYLVSSIKFQVCGFQCLLVDSVLIV